MIACDAVICLWFCLQIVLTNFWIRRETAGGQKEYIQITDFAVRVSKLPKVYGYDQLEELAAALTLHIEKVVKVEDQVFMGESNHGKSGSIGPEEIVSINFALRPFENYRVLIHIEELV